MSWVAYDIEIRYAIPDGRAELDPGIRYCEGWHDHAGMGVACAATYDSETGDYEVHLGDRKGLAEFREVVLARERRVSFNGKSFDDLVLAAAGCDLPPDGHYDMFREVSRSLRQDGRPVKGHGLSPLGQENLGRGCDDLAACCPGLWQSGRVWMVMEHCLRDVEVTAGLYQHILDNEALRSPVDGSWIHLEA